MKHGCRVARSIAVLLLATVLPTSVWAQQTVEGLNLDFFADDIIEQEKSSGSEQEKPKRFWNGWFDEVRVRGYLKSETAYRYHEPRSITKIRNILYLTTRYPFSSKYSVNLSGWAYYDLAYDLFDYDTIAARARRNSEEPLVFVERLREEKDSPVAEIRELYVDMFLGDMDIRLGKQYIIWGVLEGVRVVDEINPMDFREMILPDLLDYRISLWSAKLDYYLADSKLQLVWIPDLRFHKPAPRGSEWELLQDVCVDQDPEIVCVDSKPESWRLEDSEFGIKWETTWLDAEISLNYFYTWDDFPVIFRAVRVETTDEDPAFFPTYSRISMYGGTAVRQLGRYILKGELAYVTGKYFGTKNTVDNDNNGFVDYDGELQKEHVRWGLGVEFNLLGMDIAPGVTQWIILDHQDEILQDKYDTSINLFLRKEIPQRSAVFQMLVIHLVNMEEILIKPKVTFQVDDRFQLGVGIDMFYGRKSDFGANDAAGSSSFDPSVARAQFIGNFHDNDRLYLEFKYSF